MVEKNLHIFTKKIPKYYIKSVLRPGRRIHLTSVVTVQHLLLLLLVDPSGRAEKEPDRQPEKNPPLKPETVFTYKKNHPEFSLVHEPQKVLVLNQQQFTGRHRQRLIRLCQTPVLSLTLVRSHP